MFCTDITKIHGKYLLDIIFHIYFKISYLEEKKDNMYKTLIIRCESEKMGSVLNTYLFVAWFETVKKTVFVFKNSLKNWSSGYTIYGKTGKIIINN